MQRNKISPCKATFFVYINSSSLVKILPLCVISIQEQGLIVCVIMLDLPTF